MARNEHIGRNLDWITVLLYLSCILWGVFSIYSAIYNPDTKTKLLDISNSAGRQLMFVGVAALAIIAILVIDHRFWETFAEVIYGLCIVLLIAVLFLGSSVKGSHSWFKFGAFSLQPLEFAKIGTALMLARFVSQPSVSLSRWKDIGWVAGIVLLPMLLVVVSKETGGALVFAAFIIMLYREGLPGIYPVVMLTAIMLFVLSLFFDKLYICLGLIVFGLLIFQFIIPRYERNRKTFGLLSMIVGAMVFFINSVDFILKHVLLPHQSIRLLILVDPYADPRKAGWNVIQSKIAIGTGRLWGKGFLQGTQTKFDFVPEQQTDYIFCTIGEELGFVGSTLFIALLLGLVLRIITLAERQRTRFARIFGYCLASVLFFHFLVNIGMTIGFMPTIGIPLPFFSSGGSSFLAFSIFLFIFLKLDAQRPFTLARI